LIMLRNGISVVVNVAKANKNWATTKQQLGTTCLVHVARTMSSQPNVYVTRPDVDVSGLELLRKR